MDFVTLIIFRVAVIVGFRTKPPLSGFEKEMVRLAEVLVHSIRCLNAGMVHILGRIYHSWEIRGAGKVSVTKLS